ncbi:MAG: carotene biosynthesis associated membrane protein [halophilic archaeon J07HX5]|nr:MAG: carotene biosynthesis associated membrane protein [halophilic archaeon J07HX5]
MTKDGPTLSTPLPSRDELWRAVTDRQAAETLLDRMIMNNRFTIAVVFPIVGAVLLLASAEGVLPNPVAFNPLLVLTGVLVMRLPLVAGVVPLVDRRAGIALLVLTGYTYAIEYVGASTGWPYGEFSYEVALGPMLAGVIPVALPVFFLPLVLNSYLLSVLLLGERTKSVAVRLPVVAVVVVTVDLVLDPAAVALGFWEFGVTEFYGVPYANYAGWVLSAAVATVLIDVAFSRTALLDRLKRCSYMLDDMVSFVLLWGTINAFYGQWIPFGVAVLFAVGLVRVDRFDFVGLIPWRVA